MRLTAAVPFLALLALMARDARAQSPQNGEFVVNASTAGNQFYPSVALDAQGSFVVSWDDAATQDVKARRFDAHGIALGGEFTLNAHTTGLQNGSMVAARPDGGFVALWHGTGPTLLANVFLRVFDANGAPDGIERSVNSNTSVVSRMPSVSVKPDGSFVVAWRAYAGGVPTLFARPFGTDGAPVGNNITVGQSSSPVGVTASVAAAASGDFVVAWNATQNVIRAQRYDPAGQPLGASFQVNAAAGGTLAHALTAADPAGGFVVAWNHRTASATTINARAFDAAGTPRGAEFLAGTSRGFPTSLLSLPDGTFVVAWHDELIAPFDGFGSAPVLAQRFSRAGASLGAPVPLNLVTRDAETPALSVNASGSLVASWFSFDAPDGNLAGVLARRFPGLAAAAMTVDESAGGNRVLEAGETVPVAPAWRNAGTVDEAFAGTAAAFTGPGDSTYTIADGAAAYETVAGGSTRSCADGGNNCYSMSVSIPSSRPAVHWDASFEEALRPGGLFPWTWRLHVGGSFTDVPATSPFYRTVETMLHRGVTGGCAAAAYCPLDPVTRAQMAVFLLTSKEGPGYQPVACTPPNVFNDVPETSPFCRWIEELAARGVTGGCGGGNYCPENPVTRQEMAVFVLHTLDPALDPPACGTPVFNDVPASSVFCRWVEELARRHVVTGCGGGAYCPLAAVSREQMSVFLGVTFGLTLYGP